MPIPVATRSRRRPEAARLLRLWVRIPLGHGCLSIVSVVCCQVEVSAASLSFVQKSPTDCGLLCVWSKNLVNDEALAHWGLPRPMEKESVYMRGSMSDPIYTDKLLIKEAYIIYLCSIHNYCLNWTFAKCVVYVVPNPLNGFQWRWSWGFYILRHRPACLTLATFYALVGLLSYSLSLSLSHTHTQKHTHIQTQTHTHTHTHTRANTS